MKNTCLNHDYPHQIPFYDVDSMHIVWHGHYVKYLELARCAWLERLDCDYRQMQAEGYAWPVTRLELKYIRPARFGQHIIIRTGLREYESCLKLDYRISDRDSGEIPDTGKLAGTHPPRARRSNRGAVIPLAWGGSHLNPLPGEAGAGTARAKCEKAGRTKQCVTGRIRQPPLDNAPNWRKKENRPRRAVFFVAGMTRGDVSLLHAMAVIPPPVFEGSLSLTCRLQIFPRWRQSCPIP